jgi:outer membrane protein assembly factor BamE (lipoprotein component of BamABCDE complex)
MADDLVRTRRLDGMTRAQVIALLGEPPKTPYFKDYDLVYLLGPERGSLRIDSEWLVVKFGRDGRADARIARD